MKTAIVTNLKRHATKILAELAEDREPVLITEHGRPAAYIVDVDSYERQQDRLRILEGIARGERAIAENRVLSEQQATEKMKRWLI